MSDSLLIQLILVITTGYVLFTCAITVLASYVRSQVGRYEVLRQTKQMQWEYLQYVRSRRGLDQANVDIIEDGPGDGVSDSA